MNAQASRIETEQFLRCISCSSLGQLFYQNLSDRLYSVPGIYHYSRCSACEFIWLSLRPKKEELPKCYPNYAPHHRALIPQQSRTWFHFLCDHVRKLILAARFEYNKDLFSGWELCFGQLLSKLPILRHKATYGYDQLFPTYVKNGVLLDVGCGAGDYLALMKRWGWKVLGVDFSNEAAQAAAELHSIDVLVGDLLEMKFSENSIDVITMQHSIEHFYDPLVILRESFRILKPGGRLIITTPNIKSLGHRLFRKNWVAVDAPRHLWLFNHYSLRQLLHQSGLRLLKLNTRANMADVNYDYSRLISKDKIIHAEKFKKTRKGQFFYRIERILIALSCKMVGEEIILVAEK